MPKTLIGRVTINYGQLPDFMEAGDGTEVVPDTAFYQIPLLDNELLGDIAFYQWVKWLSPGKQVIVSIYHIPQSSGTAVVGTIIRVNVMDNGISTPVDADGVLTENTLNFAG